MAERVERGPDQLAAGLASLAGGSLEAARLETSAQVAVRLFAGQRLDLSELGLGELPPPGRAHGDGLEALGLAPGEWLLVARSGSAGSLRSILERAVGGEGTVTSLGDARVLLELRNDDVVPVLARGCALDLHPTAFEPGACAQTLIAQVPVILWRPVAEADLFRFAVARSFAVHLTGWLTETASRLNR